MRRFAVLLMFTAILSFIAVGVSNARAAYPGGSPVDVDAVSIAHTSPKGLSASLWFASKAVPDARWTINVDRLGQPEALGSLNVMYVVPGDFLGWKGYLGAGAAHYFYRGQNELQVTLGARIFWFFTERVFPLDTGNSPYTRVGVRINL